MILVLAQGDGAKTPRFKARVRNFGNLDPSIEFLLGDGILKPANATLSKIP